MSPRLFNVYMDGLSDRLLMCGAGCNINSVWVNHIMYADDLTLPCSSAKGLQVLIDVCSSYADEFDIIFNSEKSGCLYFENKNFKLIAVPSVSLNGKIIEYKEYQKILGLFISRHGSDDLDMSRQVRGIYARASMLTRNFTLVPMM